MKNKIDAERALLTPAIDGWLLSRVGTEAQAVSSVEEAAALVPKGCPIHLALPCQSLVIEGFRLPATQHEELAGMVRLQIEKNLPYPLEEVSSDFIVVENGEKETSIISFSAPQAPLEALCEPLRAQGRRPASVTPYVLHVAAACPPEDTVLAIYPEQQQLVVAICVAGRLRWAHVLAGVTEQRLAAELPHLLLAASMEGTPSAFTRVLLAPECQAFGPVIHSIVPTPQGTLPAISVASTVAINLVPAAWHSDSRRLRKNRHLQRGLQIAAALYLIAAIAMAVHLFGLHRQAARIRAQYLAARPRLELIQAGQARFNDLAPAVEPRRSTVELLFLLQRALPNPTIRITEFDQQLDQWHITGEAPSAALAIDYATRLKADQELSAYQITSVPPQLLVNEHAQFSIFAKR